MSTGSVTQHQNERIKAEAVFPLVLTVQSVDYTADTSVFIVSPVKGYISAAYSAVNTLTAGAGAVNVDGPDGTVGTITIADASAVGTVDTMVVSDLTNGEVEAGEVIEFDMDGTPTAGAVTFTVVLSESL